MSNDLERLKSASALRAWEEDRSKSFNAWRTSVESLLAGLKSTVTLGVTQLQQLERFLRQRSTAEQVYVQALNAGLPPTAKPQAADAPNSSPPAEAAGDGGVVQKSAAQSPLLDAIAELQRAVSAARQAFATGLLETIVVSGLVVTAAEFDKTSSALLQGLDAGLLDVLEAHARAVQAMSTYHRGSIEARTSEKFSDAWLQEHRYRKAVEALRERQQAFTVQLCGAVEEAWRLEEWREEMARKVLGRFCSKLHQVETSVQSLANDGIRALASHKQDRGEDAILHGLEKVLQTSLPLPADLPPQEMALEQIPGEWPALQQVRALGSLPIPPASVLGVLGGAFQAPRRWYGSQLCVAVLTKDHWLHCFPFSVSNVRGASPAVVGVAAAAPGNANGSAAASSSTGGNGASLAYLEGVEVEPSWSFYMPASSASTAAGKPRTIEIEEVKRGFLGLRMPRRETLLADTDEVCQRWMSALQRAMERGTAPQQDSSVLVPPPPPPPPPTRQGQQPSSVEPPRNTAPKAASVASVAKAQQSSAGLEPARTEKSRGTANAPVPKVVTTAAAADSRTGQEAPAKEPPPPPPPSQVSHVPRNPPAASSTGASLTAEDVFGV